MLETQPSNFIEFNYLFLKKKLKCNLYSTMYKNRQKKKKIYWRMMESRSEFWIIIIVKFQLNTLILVLETQEPISDSDTNWW